MIAKVTYNYHISLIFFTNPHSTPMLVASFNQLRYVWYNNFFLFWQQTYLRYIISSCDSVAEHTIDADHGASSCIKTANTSHSSVQYRSSEPNSHLRVLKRHSCGRFKHDLRGGLRQGAGVRACDTGWGRAMAGCSWGHGVGCGGCCSVAVTRLRAVLELNTTFAVCMFEKCVQKE